MCSVNQQIRSWVERTCRVLGVSKGCRTANDVSTSVRSLAYTQTQAGRRIVLDTLISKHWQPIMRVTSSAAGGWVALTASQPRTSAQGDLKLCLSLTARPHTYRCFHTHNTQTHMQTSLQLCFKVDFSSRREDDETCLTGWHTEEIQYWAVVDWGLWVGALQRAVVPARRGGGRSLRGEFKPDVSTK